MYVGSMAECLKYNAIDNLNNNSKKVRPLGEAYT
jgi:hypothetical protein